MLCGRVSAPWEGSCAGSGRRTTANGPEDLSRARCRSVWPNTELTSSSPRHRRGRHRLGHVRRPRWIPCRHVRPFQGCSSQGESASPAQSSALRQAANPSPSARERTCSCPGCSARSCTTSASSRATSRRRRARRTCRWSPLRSVSCQGRTSTSSRRSTRTLARSESRGSRAASQAQ